MENHVKQNKTNVQRGGKTGDNTRRRYGRHHKNEKTPKGLRKIIKNNTKWEFIISSILYKTSNEKILKINIEFFIRIKLDESILKK